MSDENGSKQHAAAGVVGHRYDYPGLREVCDRYGKIEEPITFETNKLGKYWTVTGTAATRI